MVRLVLVVVLSIFVARAFWRLVDGILTGAAGGRPRSDVPQRGVQMVRDPVCGTFLIPDRAVSIADGRTRLFFCSNACRDKYRAHTA